MNYCKPKLGEDLGDYSNIRQEFSNIQLPLVFSHKN